MSRAIHTVISVIRLPKWLPDYIDDRIAKVEEWLNENNHRYSAQRME